MLERRTRSRRNRDLISEPLTRQRERRGDDRRDWLRKEIALDVREPGRKSRACIGDLSVGGASFVTTTPPYTDTVSVMFTIPTYVGPVIATGTVIARRAVERGAQISIVFTDLEVEAELAIAQWIDEEFPVVKGQEIIPLTQVA